MLETIGAITVGLALLAVILLLLTIALNIACGTLGAVRLRRAVRASSRSWAAWWWIARQGMRCWHGPRYDGHVGEYWAIGGLSVPLDIRDPIRRRRFY